MKLSVMSWRNKRARLAPMARRTAISCCRFTARAMSRLATFEQAMISTSPTMASRTALTNFAPPSPPVLENSAVVMGCTEMVWPALASGNSCWRLDAMV